jgi:hypothetical protein
MIIVRHVILVVILIGLILGPHIAGLAGVQPKSIENRPLATLPKFTRAAVLDASYFQNFSAYLRDNLPLRVEATRIYNWSVLRILRGSPAANVFEGRGGELFLDVEFLNPCAKDIPVDQLVDDIRAFSSGIEASGRKLFVTFAPNKSYVSPEKMSSVLRQLAECPTARRNQLRQQLQTAKDIRWIDLWSVLDRFKATSKETLFPQRGRHSTPLTGVLFAKGIIDAVQPGTWSEAGVVATPAVRSAAELPMRFMGLSIAQYNKGYYIDRKLNALPVKRTAKLAGNSRRESFFYTNPATNQPLIGGKTVVLHDSFMDLSMEPLSQYFADITFIHWNEFMALPDDVASVVAGSDRVIIEYVEDLKEESVPNSVGNSANTKRIFDRIAELDRVTAAAIAAATPAPSPPPPVIAKQ